MRKIIIIAVIFRAGLFALSLKAQGTLIASNLGLTPTGNAAIGSDSWIAQAFRTPGGYTLDSVQLQMNPAFGIPVGFSISIFSSSGADTPPLQNLGSLAGPDPTAGGIFTYSAPSSIFLPAGTCYVVVTSTSPIADGSYNWSAVSFPNYNGIGMAIDDSYYKSANGLNWTETIRQGVFQMAIYATPIPEPSALSLIFLGSGVLIFVRTRSKKHPTP